MERVPNTYTVSETCRKCVSLADLDPSIIRGVIDGAPRKGRAWLVKSKN